MSDQHPEPLPGTRPGRPAWAPEPQLPFSQMPKNADRIWTAAVPTPTRPPTPRVMIQQLYGKGPRGGLNTKAAATDLGVSQRTVQRWIKDRKVPATAAGQGLRAAHTRWRNTAAGRKNALGRKNKAALAATRRIQITGTTRISGDVRRRSGMEVNLGDNLETRENLDALIEALASGDDTASLQALEALVTPSFGGDVELAIGSVTFS